MTKKENFMKVVPVISKIKIVPILLIIGTIICALSASPKELTAQQIFTPIDAFKQNDAMKRGVNVLGYDPIWNDRTKARFGRRHFSYIRDAGFTMVRINLQAFEHMDSSNKLSSAWLKTLDEMVAAALENKLIVIIDEHDFHPCGQDPTVCKLKLNAFWEQISLHFKDAPNTVLFEILNEPSNNLTPQIWNKQFRESLSIIRATNPTRNVIVGPAYSNALEKLSSLDLPASDQHIIVTFHYYHPMRFTHQGASWIPGAKSWFDVHWGTDSDYTLLDKEFDDVKTWADTHRRPILLGEFGVYDSAPMADKVKWLSAVVRAAETRHFSWAYWQFDSNFVVYDIDKNTWVEPILKALVTPKVMK